MGSSISLDFTCNIPIEGMTELQTKTVHMDNINTSQKLPTLVAALEKATGIPASKIKSLRRDNQLKTITKLQFNAKTITDLVDSGNGAVVFGVEELTQDEFTKVQPGTSSQSPLEKLREALKNLRERLSTLSQKLNTLKG